MNELPKKGDKVIRTKDGVAFTIQDVVKAGGEEVYHLQAESGGDSLKITGASFVKEHEQSRPEFELAS